MTARSVLGVRDLCFRYNRDSEELMDHLDHDFPVGQVTAVTGPSGRGKSTLLYLLGLLIKPTSGRVELDGLPATRLSDRKRSALRASRFGFVFQDAALDSQRTILAGVVEPALYAGHRRSDVIVRARQLLEEMGVGERADHLPGQISGGQAQRVALCRCLVNDPEVVLADEPTGNLDDANTQGVLAVLRQAAREDRTVIIATHDPTVVAYADSVLTLT